MRSDIRHEINSDLYQKIRYRYNIEHMNVSQACKKEKISPSKYYKICKDLGRPSVASEINGHPIVEKNKPVKKVKSTSVSKKQGNVKNSKASVAQKGGNVEEQNIDDIEYESDEDDQTTFTKAADFLRAGPEKRTKLRSNRAA